MTTATTQHPTDPEGPTRRLALVTGGSRGIGRAAALALATDGWDLVVTYAHNEEQALAVAAECKAAGADHGVRATAYSLDLAEPATITDLLEQVDRFGPLRCLVNNAGVVPDRNDRLDTFDLDRIRDLFAINVTAPMLLAKEAVLRMSTAHGGTGGVIVNVSSRAAVLGGAGEYVDYAASKAALDAVTVGLAQETAREGVRVVGVRPGFIDTEIHAPGRLERVAPKVPMGRAGQADEVGAAIAWLASDAASYITGTTLDVAGGR